MVNESKKFRIRDYEDIFKVSKKTAMRDLKRLVSTNRTRKIGVKKGTFFISAEYVPKKVEKEVKAE